MSNLNGPCAIDSTEECLLNPDALIDYMRNSRRFRIEYRDPVSGFSNFEVTVYLNKDDLDVCERIDKICDIIAESYGINTPQWKSL